MSNGYHLFMLDYKKNKNSSQPLNELAKIVSPIWEALPNNEKQYYKNLAKKQKGNAKLLNSDRVPIDHVVEKENQIKEDYILMKDEITSTLIRAKQARELTSKEFYIIHVNSYCQHYTTKEYSPCEIAIAGFSLENGVKEEKIYHAMIKLAALPLGYSADAKIVSDETHLIPLPTYDSEDNQEMIMREILNFLPTDNGSYPPLYAKESNLSMVRGVLDMWTSRFDLSSMRIHELEWLFFKLRNYVGSSEVWGTTTMSYKEIEKDVYSYTPYISCEFHDISDRCTFCSRSIVIRYAYVICDHCCPDANIEMIPGRHLPSNAETKRYDNQTPSLWSKTITDISDVESLSSFAGSSTTSKFSHSDWNVKVLPSRKKKQNNPVTKTDDKSDLESVTSYGRSTTCDDAAASQISNYTSDYQSERTRITNSDTGYARENFPKPFSAVLAKVHDQRPGPSFGGNDNFPALGERSTKSSRGGRGWRIPPRNT